jgi:hypothetical protein
MEHQLESKIEQNLTSLSHPALNQSPPSVMPTPREDKYEETHIHWSKVSNIS